MHPRNLLGEMECHDDLCPSGQSNYELRLADLQSGEDFLREALYVSPALPKIPTRDILLL